MFISVSLIYGKRLSFHVQLLIFDWNWYRTCLLLVIAVNTTVVNTIVVNTIVVNTIIVNTIVVSTIVVNTIVVNTIVV